MQPIQDLLNRIRWDTEFSHATFEIGFFDRVANCIIRLPLQQITFDPENHSIFQFIDTDGVTHSVPLHRIRRVFRDGVCIWRRSRPDEGSAIC